MIDKEIIDLRKKLDESIENGKPYEEIYKISVELDKLIAKYYKKKLEK